MAVASTGKSSIQYHRAGMADPGKRAAIMALLKVVAPRAMRWRSIRACPTVVVDAWRRIRPAYPLELSQRLAHHTPGDQGADSDEMSAGKMAVRNRGRPPAIVSSFRRSDTRARRYSREGVALVSSFNAPVPRWSSVALGRSGQPPHAFTFSRWMLVGILCDASTTSSKPVAPSVDGDCDDVVVPHA